jgi:hypothetical protein
MEPKIVHCREVVLFWVILLAAASTAVAADPSRQGGRISQLIQARDGQLSCWGVTIELDQRTFKPKISSAQLSVTDGKYGRDLRDSLTWQVDLGGKRLTIRFKSGRGDFGSGNFLSISVHTTAFARAPGVDGVVTWSITTDPL